MKQCYLFVSQRFYWIGPGSLDGLVTHGHQGNNQGHTCREYEYPDTCTSPVGIILQPGIRHVPGDWQCNNIGDSNPLQKLLGKQHNDSMDRRTQHFAYADLFGPVSSAGSGQVHKVDTGDKLQVNEVEIPQTSIL